MAAPDFKTESHYLTDGHERWERVYNRTISQVPNAFHLFSMIGPKKYGFSQDAAIPAFRWAGCAKTMAKATQMVNAMVEEYTEEAQEEANRERIAINRRRAKKGKSQLPMKEVPRQADVDIMVLPGKTWFLWPPTDRNSIDECTDLDNVYRYVERYIDHLQEQGHKIEKRIREDRAAAAAHEKVNREVPDDEPVPESAVEEEKKESEPVVVEEEQEIVIDPVYKAEEQELDDGVVISEKDDQELNRVHRKVQKKFAQPSDEDDIRIAEAKFPYVMVTVVYPFSKYKPGHERQFLMRIEGAFATEAKEVRTKLHDEVYESLFNVCVGQHMHWHPLPISVHTVKNRVMTDCKILESTDRAFMHSKKEQAVDEEVA